MAFEKIKKENIPDQVFSALKQEILDGTFKIGDRLPSETKLSEEMGVSKSSVRIAIQRLVLLGLVETRAGDGSYVRAFCADDYLNQMYEFLLSDREVHDITEYRLATEMAATRLAIAKATRENFRRMEQLLEKMDDAIEQGNVVLHGRLDYEFHLEICRATQNDIFMLSYEIIGKMLRQHTTILNEAYIKKMAKVPHGQDVHWRLYRAIRAKDIDTCYHCYVEMFSVSAKISAADGKKNR